MEYLDHHLALLETLRLRIKLRQEFRSSRFRTRALEQNSKMKGLQESLFNCYYNSHFPTFGKELLNQS